MPRTQFTVRALLEAMLAAWLLIAIPATTFAGAFGGNLSCSDWLLVLSGRISNSSAIAGRDTGRFANA